MGGVVLAGAPPLTPAGGVAERLRRDRISSRITTAYHDGQSRRPITTANHDGHHDGHHERQLTPPPRQRLRYSPGGGKGGRPREDTVAFGVAKSHR